MIEQAIELNRLIDPVHCIYGVQQETTSKQRPPESAHLGNEPIQAWAGHGEPWYNRNGQ